jgi:type IV pilus assembly protein PilB
MQGTLFLLVAMSDPTNLTLIDDLQFMTGCRVRPALASDASIREAVDRCYGPPPAAEPPLQAEPRPSQEAPPLAPAASVEEKLQRLLRLLLEKGIISLRDFERLR